MATENMLTKMDERRREVGHCRTFLKHPHCRPEESLQSNDLDTMALGHMVVESDEEHNTKFPGIQAHPLVYMIGHKGVARIGARTWENEEMTGSRGMVALSQSVGISRNGMELMH